MCSLYFPLLLLLLQRTCFSRFLQSESGRAGLIAHRNESNATAAYTVAPAKLIFISAQIIYITIMSSVALFFPLTGGVLSLSALMNRTNASSNALLPITHIHYLEDKSSMVEEKGVRFVNGSPGHRQFSACHIPAAATSP